MKTKTLLLGLLLVIGCASLQPTTPRTYEGATVGAVLGGVAGALLDRHNPWRGGVIGGVIGAVAGGTLTEISARASREAAQANKPVEYRTEDGRGIYRAEPETYNAETRCHKIRERVWEDGRLIKDQVREICEGTKYERAYAPPPVMVEERSVYVPAQPPAPGPPPWAPAHGHRAKYRYYYYPSSHIYFHSERNLYFYYREDTWQASEWLPTGIAIDKREYVVIDMDSDKPYRFHSDVTKWYPPGQAKKFNKGKNKGK